MGTIYKIKLPHPLWGQRCLEGNWWEATAHRTPIRPEALIHGEASTPRKSKLPFSPTSKVMGVAVLSFVPVCALPLGLEIWDGWVGEGVLWCGFRFVPFKASTGAPGFALIYNMYACSLLILDMWVANVVQF